MTFVPLSLASPTTCPEIHGKNMCRSPTRGSSKTRFGTSTHFLETILRRSHMCLVVTNTRCIWWEWLYNCTNPATLDAVLKARLLLFTTLLMLQTNLDLPGQSSPRRILRYSMKLLLSLWSKHEKSHHSGLPTFCQLYVTLLVWNWARLLVATWPSCYQCSTEIDQCDFRGFTKTFEKCRWYQWSV